jgi:hypothetical protein
MAYEQIDDAQEVDTLGRLAADIILYYRREEPVIKDRLAIERKLKDKFKITASEWLLNFILELLRQHDRDATRVKEKED